MTRFERALRLAYRSAYVAGGVGILGLVGPTIVRAWAWSWTLGLLIGFLNTRMLASALKRGTGLGGGGGAKTLLSVSGAIRLALVLALLFWAITRGPQVTVWPLVVGLFFPEAMLTLGILIGRDPYDRASGEEGDSA